MECASAFGKTATVAKAGFNVTLLQPFGNYSFYIMTFQKAESFGRPLECKLVELHISFELQNTENEQE